MEIIQGKNNLISGLSESACSKMLVKDLSL